MAKRGRPSLTHGWPACASKYLKPGTRPLLRYVAASSLRHLACRPVAANQLSSAIFDPELEAHEEPPSPVVSTGCAYFLSPPRGGTTPLPRPKGEGPARCSPCRRLSDAVAKAFGTFRHSDLFARHSSLATRHCVFRYNA